MRHNIININSYGVSYSVRLDGVSLSKNKRITYLLTNSLNIIITTSASAKQVMHLFPFVCPSVSGQSQSKSEDELS